MMLLRFRVWCLSWEEEEEHGCDVVAYDIMGEYPRYQRGVVHVPNSVLFDASDAAEAYADYVHDHRDGYESSWPLAFRVRDADGTIADFEVDREYVVEFHASPVKAAKPGPPKSEPAESEPPESEPPESEPPASSDGAA